MKRKSITSVRAIYKKKRSGRKESQEERTFL